MLTNFVCFNAISQPTKQSAKDKRFNLDELIVTGQYEETSLNKSVYKVKIIDSKRIQSQGAFNLQQVLSNELNVRIIQDPMLGSSIKLQGVGGNNIKILIDGVPVTGRESGNIDLTQIDMNNVERSAKNNNIKTEDYNKYRNNPDNIVKKNDYETPYTPYKESFEKKALQDKLLFLERQMAYYKDVITKENSIEHFDNKDESSNFKTRSNDMIDLIILIIIGLLIIFVMDFIFKMGKQIGAKKG